MTTRRDIFGLIGLSGAMAGGFAIGTIVYKSTKQADATKQEILKQLESTDQYKLSLSQTYGELEKQPPNTFSLAPKYVPGTENHVSVDMKVGPDGELYLKTNGRWRRIVTE